MLLAIDTATEFAGLALYDENMLWAEEIWRAARNHTVELMPRLKRMLDKAQLKVCDLAGIAVAIGPGSYTGVRIGVALAKGLALPYNLPVVGVPTLDIAAYPHQSQNLPVIAVAQAGRRRILAAHYGWVDQTWRQTSPPVLTTVPELAQNLSGPALVTGELQAQHAVYLQKAGKGAIKVVSPLHRARRPGALAELGAMKLANAEPDDLDGLTPIYLREP